MQRLSMSASHRPELGGSLTRRPPMQTDSRPQRAHPPRPLASGVHAAIAKKKMTPPPVLASEVLREDLAPIEPGRHASRLWDLALALLYLAVGICLRINLGVSGVSPDPGAACLAAAAAVGATAVVPFPYLWRAVVGGVIGASVVALGIFGGGPLALLTGPGSTPWVEPFRVATCVALPAALLFRSHYRAYERGRVLLGAAFVLSLPFLVHEAILTTEGPLLARVAAGLALLVPISGLFAFMSSPPTSMTVLCAEALTAVLAIELGLRQLYMPRLAGAGPLAYVLTGLAFFASVVPIALGLFQTFAAIYAREARKVDLHRPSSEPEAPPSEIATSD
jgi:hypothetical protein